MESQTSLVARQVRIQQWAAQIRECQNRPQDMDVSTWCSLNGITKACYYYRLKQVRQTCLEATGMELPTFIEVETDSEKTEKHDVVHYNDGSQEPVAVIRNNSGLSVEIFPSASAELIANIIKVIPHAE